MAIVCAGCGSKDIWHDDDLHWQFCKNYRCDYHLAWAEKRGYSEMMGELESRKREADRDNGLDIVDDY